MSESSSTIGVWWDINTCPVPADLDPSRVRTSIESALSKHFGGEPRRVTIFAIGNLEYVSSKLLEAISSSGIFLKHTPFRGSSVNSCLYLWRQRTPPPAKVLLISGDSSWFHPFFNSGDSSWFHPFFNSGYTVLRAFPQDLRSSLPSYTCDQEWDWETLLKENYSGGVVEKSKHILKDEPGWFCDLCEIPSKSCDEFINHLKSTKHKQKLTGWKEHVNPNLTFPKCEICEYTGYDDYNMAFHYKSDEHKQNERAANEALFEED